MTMATTRRDILKKAAFVAPLILTLPASAAFAKSGSSRHKEKNNNKSSKKNK